MKTLEELATITTTDISDVLPKIIIDQVEEAARPKRVARNLVRINRDLVKTKGRSIFVPKRGTLTASDVSEGSTLTPSKPSSVYETVEIIPKKVGVGVAITQEAIDGVELDVVNDLINEAGEALAQKEDLDIRDKFLAPGAAGSTITASTPGVLSYEDIIAARSAVLQNDFNPQILVIHPDQEGDLLKDDRFIDASKFGDREPILNGQIGKIAGLKVLVSTNMTSGTALVVDPDRAAWMAIKRETDLKRKEEPSTDSVELYFYREYGVEVVNPGAVAVITGC